MLLILLISIIKCKQFTSSDNQSNIINNTYRYNYIDSDGVGCNKEFIEFRPRHFNSNVFNLIWSSFKIKSLDDRSDNTICLYWYSINQSIFYKSSMKILVDFFDKMEIPEIKKRAIIELFVDFMMKINQDLFRDPNIFLLRNKINNFKIEPVSSYGANKECVVEYCFDYFIYTMFTGLESLNISHGLIDKIRLFIENPSNQMLPLNFFFNDQVINLRKNMQICIVGVVSIVLEFIHQ